MDKSEMILTAERHFAREVTLAVIVGRPLTVWHYLMPGMFIVDYFRRNFAIRQYTKHFMFPREIAVAAARDLARGYESASVDARVETDVINWLSALGLDSEKLAAAQKGAIDVLILHYGSLLAADEDSVDDMIRRVYPTRRHYEEHLQKLTEAEREIDRALVEKLGAGDVLVEKLQVEAQQVALRRRKIMDDIF